MKLPWGLTRRYFLIGKPTLRIMGSSVLDHKTLKQKGFAGVNAGDPNKLKIPKVYVTFSTG